MTQYSSLPESFAIKDEETDVPRDDALSSTSGEVSLPVAEKAPTPRPPRQPPRRLHGSVKDLTLSFEFKPPQLLLTSPRSFYLYIPKW